MKPVALVAATLALGLIVPSPARARDRLLREYDERSGLWVSEIVELAQDSTGFLWVGTSGGLVRFDGREMRPWASDRLHHVVRTISCGRDGRIMVAAAESPLFDVTRDGVDTLLDAGGRAIDDWIDAAYDVAGNLWVARPQALERRDATGHWRRFERSAFDSSAFYHVRSLQDGRVMLATERGLYAVSEQGAARLASIPFVRSVAPLPGGRLAVLTRRGRLSVIGPQGERAIYQGREAGNAVVARGEVLWATIDQYVMRFAPDAAPDTIAPTPTTPNGRPLLVDQEGSLWLGGFHGLLQFPEPETVIWGERDGLPSPPHGYMIQHDDEGVWVTTWYGAAFIPDRGAMRQPRPLGLVSGGFFPDGAGALWWADRERGFMRREHGRERFFPRLGLHRVVDAARRADGTLWLATDDGPFLTRLDGGAPMRVAAPPPPGWGSDWNDTWLGAVALDRHGVLWLSRDEEVAHANADSLAAGLAPAWTVERLSGGYYCEALAEMPSGHMWCGTGEGGVWRRLDDGHWETIPGTHSLSSPRVYGFAASPSGGLWVLADGSIARIRERLDLPAGWEIVETLSAWQGAPSRQAGGIVELADGKVWLASLSGIVEMPAGCRHAERRPPAVQLVEQRVDGRPLPLDRPLRLPYQRNRLELRFAALSYRDRSLLRYEFRARTNAPWTSSMEPDFHVVDLAPGRYTVDVRASLDGERWTDPPAMVRFVVLQPWYREPWALALFALAAAALLFGAHRLRVALLLRLERQRTRIAMDLHDQMGSGLGSIGILAGLASATHVDEPTRRKLVSEISRAAGELGGTLTDIVSALREGSDRLESFAFRLAERGGRLFPAPPPAFATKFPERWPETSLAFGLRRELHLIALEALHNAARHADAGHVTLGLAPDGDPHWRLWIEDDGRGLPAGPAPAGHGLENMSRRAAVAGATISFTRLDGGGTRVEVRFDPRHDPGDAAHA